MQVVDTRAHVRAQANPTQHPTILKHTHTGPPTYVSLFCYLWHLLWYSGWSLRLILLPFSRSSAHISHFPSFATFSLSVCLVMLLSAYVASWDSAKRTKGARVVRVAAHFFIIE